MHSNTFGEWQLEATALIISTHIKASHGSDETVAGAALTTVDSMQVLLGHETTNAAYLKKILRATHPP